MVRKQIAGLADEPPLSEVLDDPVIRAVMARDRVKRATLEALIADVRARLNVRDETPHRRRGGGHGRREPYLFSPR